MTIKMRRRHCDGSSRLRITFTECPRDDPLAATVVMQPTSTDQHSTAFLDVSAKFNVARTQ
jgi:hypothetical protein